MTSTQKVNDKCDCGSGIKYKKCCKPLTIPHINDEPLCVEGTLRLQNNLLIAKSKYGSIFNATIISTKYFGDDEDIPTLVCKDDIKLVLGKPRHPENFTNNEYKIKLIDRNNCGLYSIEV